MLGVLSAVIHGAQNKEDMFVVLCVRDTLGGLSRKMSKYIPAKRLEKGCLVCGTKFIGLERTKYCSPYCKNQKKQENKKIKTRRNKPEQYTFIKKCAYCDNDFEPKNLKSIYCSDNCKMWGTRKSYIPKVKETKVCMVCNKKFKSSFSKSRFCSSRCSIIHFRNKSNTEEYCLKHNAYLKLRFEILKRDNFTCQYCGRNVKEDKVKLHLDHIIPKSKGGKNETDNYTTSCFECNEGKKDILLELKMLSKENKNGE